MLWLSYEWTKEEKFLVRAMENIHSFQKRLDQHFVLDHHDISFFIVYLLEPGIKSWIVSCVKNRFYKLQIF